MAKPDKNAKQQILDKLRDVDTVLVAVNSNPSVDELSAAMGTTLALNKIGKHATAVFSGEVPMAIEFLEPGKTFENTVDSLRDFIIALDKEKADHLRYKVEGEMVKIFITPYRTTIDDSDLEFSQGDYNVQMVLGIGVRDNNDLDRALADHGRIMHDATVAGISIGSDSSNIGSITWHDNRASSYSELLADLVVKIRTDKDILDEQIATALLTGIVAATERFSNEHTSSEAMTVSAQLMAAGANQQLIATKLEEADELSQPAGISMDSVTKDRNDDERSDKNQTNDDGSTSLAKGKKTKINRAPASEEPDEPPVMDRPAADGTMTISHEKRGDIDQVAEQTERERQSEAARHAEDILAQGLPKPEPAAPGLSVADLQSDLKKAADQANADAEQVVASPPQEQPQSTAPVPQSEQDNLSNGFIETPLSPPPAPPSAAADGAPSFGGTLNATSEQAAADKRREEEMDRNKTILSHEGGSSYAAGAPAGYPAVNSFNENAADAQATEPQAPADSTAVSSRGHDIEPINPPEQPPAFEALSSPPQAPMSPPTLADIDSQNRNHGSSTSDAMAEALTMANSTNQQQQYVPTDINALPPLPSAPQTADPSLGGLPPLPPMPDINSLPPLPPVPGSSMPSVSPSNQVPVAGQNSDSVSAAQPAPQSNDPAAFQIPAQ